MNRISLFFSFAFLLVLTGCGEKTATEKASAPDAEQPYAEPVAPPTHTETATRPDLKPSGNDEFDPEALAELANETGAERGKVDNVTSDESADEKAAIKQAATAADQDGEAPDNAADPFGSLVGDPARGKRLYAQCQACHAVVEGQNRVGPSLYGIIGSPAGAVDGFNYSPAVMNSNITWTEDVLFAYLETPQEYLPGTRMFFPGVAKPQDRADIIAYLKSLTE